MKKKTYEKPSMTIVLLRHKTMLLTVSGEGDPIQPDAAWWDGEGD
jgi:hypothetical protein